MAFVPDPNGAGGTVLYVIAATVLIVGFPVIVGLLWRVADRRKTRPGKFP